MEKPKTEKTFAVQGKRVAAARARIGLSQAQLAAKIGRSVSAVTKMEAKEVVNVFHAMRRPLMQALEMTPEQFDSEIVVAGRPLPPSGLVDFEVPADLADELEAEAKKWGIRVDQLITAIVNLMGSMDRAELRKMIDEMNAERMKIDPTAMTGGKQANVAAKPRPKSDQH